MRFRYVSICLIVKFLQQKTSLSEDVETLYLGPRPSAPSPTVGADPTRPPVPGVDLRRRSPASSPVSVAGLWLRRRRRPTAPTLPPVTAVPSLSRASALRRRPDRRSPTLTAGPDRWSSGSVAEIRFPPAVPPPPPPSVQPPPSAGAVQQGSSCSSVFSRQPRIHLSSDPPAAGPRGAWLPAWSTSEIW
ncbi:pectinesterase inhibitor 10-like [Capsicum annuum]|uniref:pectinesterase inhibitor 10-like n=1 Tax=Capsicum annuum TaxID=4072 RepID=UPI001FB1324A|nr:pectinesterase inhibitor 10-like [Capsicum annuum]